MTNLFWVKKSTGEFEKVWNAQLQTWPNTIDCHQKVAKNVILKCGSTLEV